MASTFTEGFETGPNGTALSTSNTSFVIVDNGVSSGATYQFDNTRSAHGTYSLKAATSTTATTMISHWHNADGTLQQWFRLYCYFTTNPGSNITFMTVNDSSATRITRLTLTSGGIFELQNAAGTNVATLTTAMPLNQWFRLEGFITVSTTTGQVSLSRYDSMDSVTATETKASPATENMGANSPYDWQLAGTNTSVASLGPFWLDDIGVSGAGALGPAAVPTNITIAAPAAATVTAPVAGLVYFDYMLAGPAGTVTSAAPAGTVTTHANTFIEGFDAGPNGATVMSSNSSFYACSTPPLLGSYAFDSMYVAHGTYSLKVSTTTTAGAMFSQWHNNDGTLTQWFREYLYFAAWPGSNLTLMYVADVSATRITRLTLTTAGILELQDAPGTNAVILTTAIPLNQWFRIEGFVVCNPVTGQASLSRYDSMDSVTATESVTATSQNMGSTSPYDWQLAGTTTSITSLGPFWVDDVSVSGAGPLGPATVASGVPGGVTTAAPAGVVSTSINIAGPAPAAVVTASPAGYVKPFNWMATGSNIGSLDTLDHAFIASFLNNYGTLAGGGTITASPVQHSYICTAYYVYASLAQFQADVASNAIGTGSSTTFFQGKNAWVMYDNEKGASTPTAEQNDPWTSMATFVTLAHANGLKAIIAPGMDLGDVGAGQGSKQKGTAGGGPSGETDEAWFIRTNIAGAAAAAGADIFVVQNERDQGTSEYATLFNAAQAQINAANPATLVYTEVATDVSSSYTAAQMAASFATVTADGCYVSALTLSVADTFFIDIQGGGTPAIVSGVTATAPSAAPAGATGADWTISGVTAAVTAATLAGVTSMAATPPAAVSTTAAPAGVTSVGTAGVTPGVTAMAVAGGVGITVFGMLPDSYLDIYTDLYMVGTAVIAPPGSILAGAGASGVRAGVSAGAVPGAVYVGFMVIGLSAGIASLAPPGGVSISLATASPPALAVASAPAGTISTTVSIMGAVSQAAVQTAPGALPGSIHGQVTGITVMAPLGTEALAASGTTAVAASAAPAGSIFIQPPPVIGSWVTFTVQAPPGTATHAFDSPQMAGPAWNVSCAALSGSVSTGWTVAGTCATVAARTAAGATSVGYAVPGFAAGTAAAGIPGHLQFTATPAAPAGLVTATGIPGTVAAVLSPSVTGATGHYVTAPHAGTVTAGVSKTPACPVTAIHAAAHAGTLLLGNGHVFAGLAVHVVCAAHAGTIAGTSTTAGVTAHTAGAAVVGTVSGQARVIGVAVAVHALAPVGSGLTGTGGATGTARVIAVPGRTAIAAVVPGATASCAVMVPAGEYVIAESCYMMNPASPAVTVRALAGFVGTGGDTIAPAATIDVCAVAGYVHYFGPRLLDITVATPIGES